MYDFHLFINLSRTCSIIFTYILKNVNTRICTPLLVISGFAYNYVHIIKGGVVERGGTT